MPGGAAAEPVPVPTAPKAGRAVDPEAYRIVVDRIEGPKGSTLIRGAVVDVLEAEENVDLASVRLLEEQSDVIDGSAEGYATAGKRINVMAIVRAKLRKKDDRYRITFTVIRSSDGTAAGKLAYDAEKLEDLRERVRQELWRELEPILAAERQAAEEAAGGGTDESADSEEPEPIDTEAPEVAEEPEPDANAAAEAESPLPQPPPSSSACPWLELDARGGMITRNFDYTNEQRGALRAFRLRGSGLARLDVTFYPRATARCSGASGFGIALGFESAYGASAELANRSLTHFTFGTRGELVYRVTAGNVWLTPRLGYTGRRFLVQGEFVPDIDAHAVGGGLDFGLRLGVFIGEAGGSLRLVVAAGQIQSDTWFPEASALNTEGNLRLGVAVTPWFDVFLSGGLEYYIYTLNARSGGDAGYPNGVADGATDTYLKGSLGVRFSVPRRVGPR